MEGIILAAGLSKRLKPMTDNKPKCLLKLNGEAILDYQLECLAKSNINQILLVLGYKKDIIIEHIRKSSYNNLVKVIYNDVFEKTDNAYSLSLALESSNRETDSIVILDGDIIFDLELLKKLVTSEYKSVLIADNRKKVEPEDSKVMINNGYVAGIGKTIPGNAIYTSMIKLGGKFLDEFREELKKPRSKSEWYSGPLNRLLTRYPREIHVIFTDDLLRCELDTYEDLIHAKEIYKKIKGKNDVKI